MVGVGLIFEIGGEGFGEEIDVSVLGLGGEEKMVGSYIF